MLSRALYHYTQFKLPGNLAGNRRLNYIRTQVHSLSPFDQTDFCLDWGPKTVGVWFWDKAMVQAELDKLKEKQARVIPETCLKTNRNNGLCFVHCLDGFEGQIWHKGTLVSSRYWAQQPTQSDWTLFTRSSPLVAPTESITLDTQPFSEKPWIHQGGLSQLTFDKATAIQLAPIPLIVLAAITGFYLSYDIHIATRIASLNRKITKIEEQSAPLISAKEKTLQRSKQVLKILSYNPYPSPLALLDRIGSFLPPTDAHIESIRHENGKLTLMLQSSDSLEATTYVKLFENDPYFDNVNADQGSDTKTLKLSADVRPLW